MRKLLPCLLALLLVSLMLLAAAASAHALSLPVVAETTVLAASAAEDADEESEVDGESGEPKEADGESCSTGEEDEGEEEPCAEEGGSEDEEAEECLLEDADASVVTVPGKDLVRLTVHYRASEATAVKIDARLRGTKGGLHLGSERVHVHRAGVYREGFRLGPKQMPKALAAREFEVGLHALGTPADCALDLAARASRRTR